MVRATCLVLSLAAVPAARADAFCPHPHNFLSNCGFEEDTAGWFALAGTFERTETSAHGGIASAEVDAGFNVFTETYLFQLYSCSAVNSGGAYRLGVWFEGVSGTPVANCRIWGQSWTTSICFGNVLGFFAASTVTAEVGSWIFSGNAGHFPPGSRSVQTVVECVGSQVDFVVRIDDASLLGPLFADGFETGGTEEWSAVEAFGPPSRTAARRTGWPAPFRSRSRG